MVSSLVPPKIASPNAIGGAADAARMQRVVGFYEKLPRGPAPKPKARGVLEWYSLRYMTGRNASVMPIVHVVGFFMVLGYAQNYYFHLRMYLQTSAGLEELTKPRSPQEPHTLSELYMGGVAGAGRTQWSVHTTEQWYFDTLATK
ncbi:ATP synthase f chain, mitochondrial precursor [Friedmanniomyces endolithicus]|nr:ATP synthase f chain, mitochondrial precursor [Friedmanniomyces endolithicus]KAK1821255.1 ATP synthase f chain, mitochondrial precursor [Friedmanniomyces endolithicus]